MEVATSGLLVSTERRYAGGKGSVGRWVSEREGDCKMCDGDGERHYESFILGS